MPVKMRDSYNFHRGLNNLLGRGKVSLAGLTLVETLLAAAIFAVLSVSLFMLLFSGFSVRKKIDAQGAEMHTKYIILERLAQEIRNVAAFKEKESANIGFKGEKNKLEFYSVLFDYVLDKPQVLNIIYEFNGIALSKITKYPITKEDKSSIEMMADLSGVDFSYFDGTGWKDAWGEDSPDIFPQGVKIELSFKGKKEETEVLTKYVYIPK